MYERLSEAELVLAELLRRRGTSEAAIADALTLSASDVSRIEHEGDVYLSTLSRYVAAFGGHIEVRAVFPEETITLLRGPGENTPPDRA